MSNNNISNQGNVRTVKTEILMYVLPIVIIGLVIMSGIIFKYVGSTFEDQLTRSSLNNAQEVSDGVSAWLETRMLETQNIRTIGDASRKAAEEAETVSAATEEQSASVMEISNASDSLSKMAMELQNEISKFKL